MTMPAIRTTANRVADRAWMANMTVSSFLFLLGFSAAHVSAVAQENGHRSPISEELGKSRQNYEPENEPPRMLLRGGHLWTSAKQFRTNSVGSCSFRSPR